MATASDGAGAGQNDLQGGFMKEEDEQKERQKEIEQQQDTGDATHSVDSSKEGADTTAQSLENSEQAQTESEDSKSNLSVDARRRQRQRTPPTASASSSSNLANSVKNSSNNSPPPTPPARLAASSAYSINSNNERRLARRLSGSPSSISDPANPSTSSSLSSPTKTVDAANTSNSNSDSKSTSPHNADASNSTAITASSLPNHATQASPTATQQHQGQTNGTEPGAATSSPSSSPSSSSSPQSASTSSPSNYASSSSPKQEAGSSSPSSSSSSPMQRQSQARSSSSSSSSRTQQSSQPARRVKVYALHECNWIDLGTGSCTYHRGIIHRKRQRVPRPVLKDGSIAPLFHSNPKLGPTSELKSVSDRSAAELEEAKAVEKGWMDDGKYEWIEEIKLIELEAPEENDEQEEQDDAEIEEEEEQEERTDEFGRTVKSKKSSKKERKAAKTDEFNALDETGEEETAWIEVLKEGRWKTDPPSNPSSTAKAGDEQESGEVSERRKEKAARKKRRREDKEASSSSEVKGEEEGASTKKRKADDGEAVGEGSSSKKQALSTSTASEDSSESSSGDEEKPSTSSTAQTPSSKSEDDYESMIGPKEASPTPSPKRSSGPSYQPKWTMRLEPPEMTGDTVIDREMFHASYFADEGEEIIGRYRRQQDTLIVWKTSFSVAETFALDPRTFGEEDGWFPPILSSLNENAVKENGAEAAAPAAPKQELELALSFAATSACGQVWEWIKSMHLRWLQKWMEENHIILEDGDLDLLDITGSSTSNTNKHDEGTDELVDEYIAGRNAKLASLANSTPSASAKGRTMSAVEIAAAQRDLGITPASSYGLGLGFLRDNNTPLPDPNMINIDEIERHIRAVSRSAAGREKMSSLVVRNEFLPKLFPIFREYEDLESITDLHTITNLMYAIINLNDHTLWEHILDDSIFMDVIDILEYDPEYPTMKANYRAHLSDPNLFVEVVPISDPSIKSKIHQIYRLQYLKDVILARILEDSAFSSINSFIYFHQVDIVQYLNGSAGFWKQLFGEFFSEDQKSNSTATNGKESALTNGAQHQSRSEEQHDAIAFLQSFCQMVKQLQPIMRTNSFRLLCDKGVLRVINFALSKMAMDDLHIRVATVEIFMLLVDHDTSGIRAFILQENRSKTSDASKGGKKTLLYLLIDTFHKEEDLGVKAQLSEAIRILLLPPGDTPATETALQRSRPDPYAEEFLQYFYEHCISHLLEPLLKGLPAPTSSSLASSTSSEPDPTKTATPASPDLQDLPPPTLALYTHLCELLCFFVVQHSFRSKFFILSSNISSKVSQLLLAKPKHLRLAALRFFRACIGRNDDFYNRYFVKNNIFKNLVILAKDVVGNENLLTSACLEFFEFIRVNNVKNVLDSLMSIHEQSDMRDLAERDDVFNGLFMKWEQNQQPPPREASSSDLPEEQADATFETSSEIAMPSSQPDKGPLDLDEEKYFNAEDDEDEDEIAPEPSSGQSLKRSQTSTLLSKFTSGGLLGSNLPPSHAAKSEDDDDSDLLRRKRQKTDEGSVPSGKKESASPTPSGASSTDPEQELEKIRDKRKRAEDEEDEEDVLAKKKAATSSSTSNAGIGAAKKAPVKNGGKLTLLFGKK